MGAPADLQPDDIVDGRYRVVRRLGAGAMGVIYLAQHVTLRRTVALKVLRAELTDDADLASRFEAEARAASAIGHPHIVSVFDLGRCPDGSPYMAMEFLDGVALSDHLAVEGPLPWAKAVDITGQVLSALAAAHNHGIVHRDLKPENIFLVERLPGVLHVKLLDFGISKVLANPSLTPDRRPTSVGTIMGTVEYMSPEQARGQNELVDERTDIYATGAVLYEMLAGKPPFRGNSYNAVLSAVIEHRFVPIASAASRVPPSVQMVVTRALALDRKDRFATANEMRDALLATDPTWGQGPAATTGPTFIAPTPPAGLPLELPEPAAVQLVKLDRWAAGGPPSVAIMPVEVSLDSAAPIDLVELPPRKLPPLPVTHRQVMQPTAEPLASPGPPPRPPALGIRPGARRALAYLSLVFLATGGVAFWLRTHHGSLFGGKVDVAFDVKPEGASLWLDGASLGGGASLKPGSTHVVSVTAPGFLGAEAHLKAEEGRVRIHLLHPLPAVVDDDVMTLPTALPSPSSPPATWDDVDRNLRRVEMLRECLARARQSDCRTLREMAQALAPSPAAVAQAYDAYVQALGDRIDAPRSPGRKLIDAEITLRLAIWAERTQLDVDELAIVATDGIVDDDFRARRELVAARTHLAFGPTSAAAYTKRVEAYDRKPVRSWPSPSPR